MKYINVEDAKKIDGMRLVLSVGVPGPWGESAKALFHVKGISYTAVVQIPGAENTDLMEWTGQNGAPVAIYNDERFRVSWESLIWLAEEIAPDPPLIPSDARERALMFGLLREWVGENGLAWVRRLQLLDGVNAIPDMEELFHRLGEKYGYSKEEASLAEGKAASVLKMLCAELQGQKGRGSRYYIGQRLSALDIYSAVFSAVMLHPLSHKDIPMPGGMRTAYEKTFPLIEEALDPILLDHRDYIFKTYLKLPMDF